MKDVYSIYEDAQTILRNCGITVGNVESVNVNTRAKRRWGCSKYKNGNFTIEISDRLLADEVPYNSALTTMVHELLHCDVDKRSHTGEWKRCAEIVNQRYPYLNIKRTTSPEEKGIDEEPTRVRHEDFKYFIKCCDCGRVHKYKRASKVVTLVLSQPGSCKCCCGSNKLVRINKSEL